MGFTGVLGQYEARELKDKNVSMNPSNDSWILFPEDFKQITKRYLIRLGKFEFGLYVSN